MVSVLVRTITSAARAAVGARLSCLLYHRVRPSLDPLSPTEVTAEIFDWQMAALASEFDVMPLSTAIDRLKNDDLPPRAACVTFDDGYADNHDIALPILQKYQIPACFFIATGFLDGGCMWNDIVIEAVRGAKGEELNLDHIGLGSHSLRSDSARCATIEKLLEKLKYLAIKERMAYADRIASAAEITLSRDLMMSASQVLALARAGMEIGAHTVNHPILTTLPSAEARWEIVESKGQLEKIVSAPVRLFAYPNGKPNTDYAAIHVAMVRDAGFKAAVTTSAGAMNRKPDLFQIPRFTPWDRTPDRFVLRLAGNMLRRTYSMVSV